MPRSIFSMNETAFDMLAKVKEYLNAHLAEKKFPKIKDMVFSIVENYELESAKTTEVFSGIPGALKELKEMNLKIALCTISGERATEYQLDRFNLRVYFDAIITRDDVAAVKPHPAHLREVLDILNVMPQNAILVGDSVKDMSCADKLGVLTVGVITGLSSSEELINSGAHYIASSASELPKLIRQLNKAG